MHYINKPRVLFLSGRETSYPLNRQLIASARTFAELEVIDPPGEGASILGRSLRAALRALPRLVRGRDDLVLVGFFGHLLAPWVRAFSRRPVLFYPLISAHETLVEDRKSQASGSIAARLAHRLDRAACRSADHLLLDTGANIEYFSAQFGIARDRFTRFFVGSDEGLFYPQRPAEPPDAQVILFYGTYLPLHGLDVIIDAAARLQDRPGIRFRLIGRGLEYGRISARARELGLGNVEFAEPVPLEALPAEIARAAVCLGGHFSGSEKARRVIAGKTYHALAMGKPAIVGDNPANRELLTHGADAWFVPPGDPAALAGAIKGLVDDPELMGRIGAGALRTFRARASIEALAPVLEEVVERMTGRS